MKFRTASKRWIVIAGLAFLALAALLARCLKVGNGLKLSDS